MGEGRGGDVSATLYVGHNLPESITKDHILQHFKTFVPDIDVLKSTVFTNKAGKRHCKLVFTNDVAAERAISQMNGTKIRGFKLHVNRWSLKKKESGTDSLIQFLEKAEPQHVNTDGSSIVCEPKGSFRAYVGSNLPDRIQESTLKQHFQSLGYDVRSVQVITTKQKQTRFAIVTLPSQRRLDEAVKQVNGTKLAGYTLTVSPKMKRKGSSHNQGQGQHPKQQGKRPSVAGNQSTDLCTVILRGIPNTVDDSLLRPLCEAYGKLTRLEVNRNEGTAVVSYPSPEVAATASSYLNGMQCGGGTLSVVSSASKGPVSVKVTRLPKSATEKQLRGLMRSIQGVSSVVLKTVLAQEHDYAYINCENGIAAEQVAQNLNGMQLLGSTMKATLQQSKKTKENEEVDAPGADTAEEGQEMSEPEIPPTWRSDYEEAVKKQGSVKVAINCCIFAGPPGKGKSCLKHLLVHDKPKEVKTSTGVMEKPDVVTISAEKYAVEGTSVWLPLTDDKMAGSIKSSCQKRKYHIPEDGPKDRHGKLAQPIIEINPSTAASKATSRSSPADPSNFESDSLNLQPSANTADVSAFQQAHFRLMRNPNLGEGILLNGAQFVHLLDTGGQPSFQAVLPLLLDVPCTYMLVFNAAEGLNAPVPITYRPDDTTVVESGSRPETAWAMMLRSLSSVYTLVHKVSSDVRALLVDNRLPPLRTVLVGTFADQLEQMGNITTATEEIGRQIKQLENKPYYSSLIPNSEGQLFHLVNNLPRQEVSERTRREQASINNLREVLSHPAGALNAKIPIGWYQFEMVSRMVDQKFFNFSELLDHAHELKCITSADPSREFRCLLQLFHSLRVFTFIDREDVSHMVCTDSRVFLQVVSKLLAVEFKVPKCLAVRTFKETGILSLDTSLFNELGISKEVDPAWLLRCLCYLGVAACLSLPSAGTLKYFIPAALPSEDKENVSEHGSVAPLQVAFQFEADAFLSTEDLPHGIFARLAVELANKGWKVVRKKNTRLAIRFQWKGLDISIVESAGCIRIIPILSVHAKRNVAELHERCAAVRSTVEAAIQTSAQAVFGSKFAEKSKPIFAFECPCEALPSHLAVPSEDTLVCNLSSQRQEYSKDQSVWFCPIEGAQLQPHPSNPTILQLVDPTLGRGGVCSIPPLVTSSTDSTDSPQRDDAILSEEVSDHPRHLMLFRRHISRRAAGNGWAVLEGVGLDMPTIAACFTAHPLNEEGAVQEGLTKWCGGKGVQPPTWGVLVEAIEYANIAQQDIGALRRALSSSCL